MTATSCITKPVEPMESPVNVARLAGTVTQFEADPERAPLNLESQDSLQPGKRPS